MSLAKPEATFHEDMHFHMHVVGKGMIMTSFQLGQFIYIYKH